METTVLTNYSHLSQLYWPPYQVGGGVIRARFHRPGRFACSAVLEIQASQFIGKKR